MPRMPELPETLDARQQEVFDRIRSGPRGRVRGPLALWLNSPELAERAQHLGELLRFNTVFDPRLSELAILLVARHHNCQFEWYVHAPIAESRGLDAAAIEAIRTGAEPAFARADEVLVHRYVTALLRRNRVPDDAYAAFEEAFGRRGVIEMAALIGYYALGAYTLNAVELEAPADAQPLPV